MRVLGLALLLLTPALRGQSPVDHNKVIEHLGAEADAFERTAYRIAGREVLKQTVPNGVRVGPGRNGTYTRLPGYTREIISEYGFVSLDVPGGMVKEVRRVLTIDGLRWNKESKSLKQLARDLMAGDEKSHQRTLETFEEHGLTGFVSDLGQIILLFARGGVSRYEFQFERLEQDGSAAFTYLQLDGNEAVTVFGETKIPVRQKMRGRVWVEQGTLRPFRISMDSTREYGAEVVTDHSAVLYETSSFGTLLPARIVHEQYLGKTLLVTDEYVYSGWRQVLPAPGKRVNP